MNLSPSSPPSLLPSLPLPLSPAEAYESEYAEVSAFSKRQGPTESHRPEESVEYGEVRVHTPP